MMMHGPANVKFASTASNDFIRTLSVLLVYTATKYYASLSSYNNTSQAKLGEFVVVLSPRIFFKEETGTKKAEFI